MILSIMSTEQDYLNFCKQLYGRYFKRFGGMLPIDKLNFIILMCQYTAYT
jgi:hypothetical protein